MAEKEIICANCGKSHIIDLGEYNYQIRRGRKNFFCSGKCAAIFNNQKNKKLIIQKACEHCGVVFDCKSPYTKRFCSRSCASAGSITDKRLAGNRKGGLNSSTSFNIFSAQHSLKHREAWKYVEIKQLLDTLHLEHEFEYIVDEKYIFDLFISKWNLLIEFDGDYHLNAKQEEFDNDKSSCALNHGYELVRISTQNNVVISPASIYDIISKHI